MRISAVIIFFCRKCNKYNTDKSYTNKAYADEDKSVDTYSSRL